jgi:hypothetical protein
VFLIVRALIVFAMIFAPCRVATHRVTTAAPGVRSRSRRVSIALTTLTSADAPKCKPALRECEVLSAMADSKKYRDEAERLRSEAMQTDHRETRSTMIEIADLYDRMAETLEKQRPRPKSD